MIKELQDPDSKKLNKKMLDTLLRTSFECKNANNINILLADDDDDDYFIIQEALDRSNIKYKLTRFDNGEDTLSYATKYATRKDQKPDLILLDINMPKLDGHQTLERIRELDEYKNSLLIMLSTSKSDRDIKKSYDLGATSYLAKEADFNELTKNLQIMMNYWFQVVRHSRS